MNDSAAAPIRRRPKRKGDVEEVDIRARVDKLLLDAVKHPNCSISLTINRALRACHEKEHPNNLKAIAMQIRTLKSDMARINRELTDARARAQSLGVKNIHEFEESLEIWE
jgi:hypothetical protein